MAKKKAARKAKKKVEKESAGEFLSRGKYLSDAPDPRYVSTGSLQLDLLLGGGYRRGTWNHVIGPNFIGKSTLCLTAIREFLIAEPDGRGVYFDTEGRLEKHHHTKVPGLPMDRLRLLRPEDFESVEQMLDYFETLLTQDSTPFCFVFDSLDAFCTSSERSKNFTVGANLEVARLSSAMGRRLRAATSSKEDLVFFVSQLRSKPDMGYGGGDGLTTFGGQAMYFYADNRFIIKGTRVYKKNLILAEGQKKPIGHQFEVVLDKTETLNAFSSVMVPIIYGEGVSLPREVMQVGLVTGHVRMSGSWISLMDGEEEVAKIQGWDNACSQLSTDTDMCRRFRTLVSNEYRAMCEAARPQEEKDREEALAGT